MTNQGVRSGREGGVCVVSAAGRDAGGAVFELREAALATLLARAGDRPVALVSIAGVARRGKSFLLNFLLRYLYAEESARRDGSWLGAASAPLSGFAWRGGRARETTGLVLWSEPFFLTLPTGEEVAVLLLDSQGAFDDHSSQRDSAQMFALSTLLASVQVYNVQNDINENDLQHLQVFTEYAALGGGALPALQLLVRDWSAPYELPYGAAGGADYLRLTLQEREDQPRELRVVRRRLAASFGRVGCFLLPHPGLRAATDPAFTGQLADLTEEFKQSLLSLVPLLLAPTSLLVKTVEGRALRARELAPLLRAHLAAFRSHVPEPRDLLTATAVMRWQEAAVEARAAAALALPRDTLPRPALLARLADARAAALADVRPLAERAGCLDEFADLEREIDEQLTRHVETNDTRLAAAVSGAELSWERATAALRVRPGGQCWHPHRLRRDLDAARAAARARYDEQVIAGDSREGEAAAAAAGDADSDDGDPDRRQLITRIQKDHDDIIEANDATNRGAVFDSEMLFGSHMRRYHAASTFQQSAAAVDAALAAAEDVAVAGLRARRVHTEHFGRDDVFYDQLIQKLRDKHRYQHVQNLKKASKTDVAMIGGEIAMSAAAVVATGPLGVAASAGTIAGLGAIIVKGYFHEEPKE